MRKVLVAASLAAMMALGGCSTQHEYKWEEATIFASRVANANYRPGAQVNITAKPMTGRQVVIEVGYQKWYAGETVLPQSIATQLSRQLAKKGVVVTPSAAKSLQISVVGHSFLPGAWMNGSVLTLNVAYGDGRSKVLQSEGRANRWEDAVHTAIARAAVDIVNDPDVQAYINAQ